MEEKKNKCPLCSKRLVMKGGVPTCPDCGYRDPYRSGSGQPQTDYSQQPRMSYGQPGYSQSSQAGSQQQQGYSQSSQAGRGQQQSNYGQSPQANNSQQPNYGQPNNRQQSQTRPYTAMSGPSANPTKKQANPGVIAIIVAFSIIAVISIASVVVGVVFSALVVGNQDGLEWSAHWETTIGDSSSTVEEEESSVQHGPSDVSHLVFDTPESDLLKEFFSQVFDKPASSATREELNSVIRMEIRDIKYASGTEITYELSDGTTGTCYLSSTRMDTGDFRCFPNLQTLDLGRNSLDRMTTDWHNLTSLSSLTCEVSLDNLAKYMDVSQLTSLSIQPDFFMDDLSALEAYSNLEYLRLNCNHFVKSLAGLSQAETLTTFIIEDAGSIEDYSELYDMKQLKELSIESVALQDIGFISDMTALESLELIEGDMSRIDAIADRADSLKCLRLHLNKSVEDYSPVLACTGLEELELYVSNAYEDRAVPDLSMMTELKVLTLGNFWDFPDLEGLTTLESLTVINGPFYDKDELLEGLRNLTELKTFALLDASIKPQALGVLSDMTSLETLDLTGTFVWGDLNTVFGMPNLKTLILDDVDFGLMLEGMPVSESLQELDMTDANVHYLLEDGSFDMRADITRIKLGDNTEFFDHMPNLTTLIVPSHDLQDVEFAKNMSQLTYLDIRYNSVTDLSPLTGLEQLKILNCKENPVQDRTGLENVIIFD